MVVKCPRCRAKVEWEGNPFRPFCSERCKLIDFGHWANEDYPVGSDPEAIQSGATRCAEPSATADGLLAGSAPSSKSDKISSPFEGTDD